MNLVSYRKNLTALAEMMFLLSRSESVAAPDKNVYVEKLKTVRQTTSNDI